MTDSELQKYIPKAGDRIALRGFLSSKLPKSGFETKKQGLMEKLRQRLRSRKAEGLSEGQNQEDYGKKSKSNNEKDKVKIELGWMHYNKKNGQFAQVRLRSGGGTRQLQVHKTASKAEIEEVAKSLFFPDGNSSKGKIEAFHCNLTDFKADEVDETHTVADFINTTKIYKLRFYLTTKEKDSMGGQSPESCAPNELNASANEELNHTKATASEGNCQPDEVTINQKLDEARGRDIEIDNNTLTNASVKSENILQQVFLESMSNLPTETSSFSDSAACNTDVDLPELSIPRSRTENNLVHETEEISVVEATSVFTPIVGNAWIDSLGEVYINGFKQLPEAPKQFHVAVHRGHAFYDMKKFFKDNTDINPRVDEIQLSLILPNGDIERAEDSGGVTRDVITEFWQDFYECCTLGSELKVPTLRHDFEKEDWSAVARMLTFGWTVEKMLPDQLAPSFLNACFNGVNSETYENDVILQEYCQFLSSTEKDLITKALNSFEEVDFDDLLDFFSNHDCKVRVTKENLKTILMQIADKELNQEPAFVREVFFNTLLPFNLEINVRNELEKLKVTTKRVLSMIDCDPMQHTCKFLLKFLRECSVEVLRRFLRYATASDLMLTDSSGEYLKIKVELVDMKGLARRPIAHTCGRVVELAQCYESFPQFRCELNAVLASNVWVMDIC